MNLINKDLLVEDLKSKKWIPILSSISLILIFIFIFATSFTSFDSELYRTIELMQVFLVSLLFLLPCVIFLVGIYQFSFIHGKAKLDFYHGLPIKRESLYVTNYLSGLILGFVPFIIFGTIALIIYYISMVQSQELLNPFDEKLFYYQFSEELFYFIISSFIRGILLTIAGYSFIGLCATATGKLFSNIFILAISVFAPFIIIISTNYFFTVSINHNVSIENFLMQFFSFFAAIETEYTGYLTIDDKVILSTIITILISLVFIFLGAKTYKALKSEDTEKFITNNSLYTIYKYISVFSITVTVLFIFVSIIDPYFKDENYYSDVALFYVLFFLIFFFVYFILSAIFNGGFYKKTITLKKIIIFLIITVIFNSITFLDPFKYKYFIPKINSIESASTKDEIFTDMNNIELVTELHKDLITYEGFSPSANNYDEDHIYFTYNLKNGNTLSRRYNFQLTEEAYETLNNFYKSDNYKNTVINNLEEFKNYVPKDYNKSNYYSKTLMIDNFLFDFKELNTDKINEIIDALIIDIKSDEEFGKYNFQSFSYADIFFSWGNVERINYSYYDYALPKNIKTSYTNTIKALDKYVGDDIEKSLNNKTYKLITYNYKYNNESKNTNYENGYFMTKFNYLPDPYFENYSNEIYHEEIYNETITIEKEIRNNFETLDDYKNSDLIVDLEIFDFSTDYDKIMNFYDTEKTFNYFNNRTIPIDSDRDLYVAIIVAMNGDEIIQSNNLGAFYK